MRSSLPILALILSACASTGPTDTSPADVAAGAEYDLLTVDGQHEPWTFVIIGRFGMDTVSRVRGTLMFKSPLLPEAYEFTLFGSTLASDQGTRLLGGWRQLADGWVEFVGSGTVTGGQQVELTEARGRPAQGALQLTTSGQFFYGQHVWSWRRRP
jgi:hypothetical protein